ncbi:metalloregulator ArsR/SmtB family transcription factor [Paraglaciecola marina]|uniref:metalloregulator ArsR/SmtB family transcription factor n=1 Tax=Paraglaciecola marina TaxID=2500157 RepID=UPI0010603472|nr:metalloregulator ArsR/SmtB family transcription factor [Paraglaciecola marina]
MITPVSFYKCLSEDTRLKCLLLITMQSELCVCDLISALKLSQPKVSRHLAELRKCGLLQDERRGKWVFYRLNPSLPEWSVDVLKTTAESNTEYLSSCLNNLNISKNLPSCC